MINKNGRRIFDGGLTSVILVSVGLLACSKEDHRDLGKPSMANDLPSEFASAINAGFRDLLVENGYPLGSVLAFELFLDPPITEEKNLRFSLRCLVEKEEAESFEPVLNFGSGDLSPVGSEISVEYDAHYELLLHYSISPEMLSSSTRILIRYGDCSNTLASGAVVDYVNNRISDAKDAGLKGVLLVSVDL